MQTKIKFSKCVQLDVAKSQYVCHHIIVKGVHEKWPKKC